MEFIYQQDKKERLDKFLETKLPEITRSQIKKLILNNQVMVNGAKSTVHHWLKPNDKITYNKRSKKEKIEKIIPEPKIIAQTENYLVIDKPHDLLVHPTDRGEKNTLVNWLLRSFPKTKKIGDDPLRPGIVHRLDKEVSGLMVIALNQKYFDLLKKQFQNRTIQKEYTALVYGRLLNETGEITTPLERDKKTGLMKAQNVKQTGKSAHTIYEVVKKFINYTLIKIKIKTGRMHQIRAHFYSIGHSITGDRLYQTKNIRKKKKILDKRIFLHAYFLSWQDENKKWLKYSSPLPKELKQFLTTIK